MTRRFFLGLMMTDPPYSPVFSFSTLISLSFAPFFSFFGYVFSYLNITISTILSDIHLCLAPSFVSPTIDFEATAIMPSLHTVDHPKFNRISTTHYVARASSQYFTATIHVGQIADFFNFEERLRSQNSLDNFQSVPLGFLEFANIWNSGA